MSRVWMATLSGRFQNCTLMTNFVFVHAAGTNRLPVVSSVANCRCQSSCKSTERESEIEKEKE